MFSEKLEGLIQASIQDGILTDKEKQAILKRAIAEGEDPSEVEIYIDSLIQKEKQTRRAKEDEMDKKIERKRKAEIGRVCPKCGRQVPPLTLVCECGFEFTNPDKEKKSAITELMEKIEKTKSEQKIKDAISFFPVPNTKEDIVDFLALSAPNAKKKGGLLRTKIGRLICFLITFGVLLTIIYSLIDPSAPADESMSVGGVVAMVAGFLALFGVIGILASEDDTIKWNQRADVWRAKFDQVLMKGRSLRGDPEFQRQLDYYEGIVNKK